MGSIPVAGAKNKFRFLPGVPQKSKKQIKKFRKQVSQ